MRRIALLATSAVFFLTLHAQKTPKEKSPSAWKTGGMFTLLAGQTGMRNWAPTGSEKLVLTASGSMNLWATKKWGKNTWSNTADLNYGLVYTHSTDTRKIDDKIDIYSKYGFGIKPLVSIGVLASLRTQFTNGYDYTESPRKRISGFFAPAYIAAGPGVQLKTKNDAFGIHVGPGVRWVIVTNSPYSLVNQGGVKPDGSQERTLADLYGVNPAKQVRWEAGLYASALFKKEIIKNVTWKSRADLNMDVRQENSPVSTTVYWTNTFSAKLNNWLIVRYDFDLYQDDNVKMFGPAKDENRTQMHSMLGVGLAVKF